MVIVLALVSNEFSYFGGGFYLILVCVANDIVFIADLCLCLFVLLDSSFVSFGFLLFWGIYFIINDLVYCID